MQREKLQNQSPPEGQKTNSPGLWYWALYDWANSAFPTVILTFVFAAYFTGQVAEDEVSGATLWTLAIGLGGIGVAIGGPIIGAAVDHMGRRKPLLGAFSLLCIIATAMLWFVKPSPDYITLALFLVVIGQLGVEYAGMLYNAMLPRIVPAERIGRWSGWGWGVGYAGGLAALVCALAVLDYGDLWFGLEKDSAEPLRASFFLAASWFAVFAIPIFIFTPDERRSDKTARQAFRDGIGELWATIKAVKSYAGLVRFLVARIIYIDALGTVFIFGGVYAAGTFGMTERDILLFGISLNITAGLGAAGFGWIDDWLGSKKAIQISLLGLLISAAVIVMVQTVTSFWISALVFGIFVGPVQAASRSYMAHAAPENKRNEMFGLYALSGKVAFICPLLVSAVTHATQSQRAGLSSVLLFFFAGLLILRKVPDARAHP